MQGAESPDHESCLAARTDCGDCSMSAPIRQLAEVNQKATEILVREIGVVDTQRFLSQFRVGSGDYTAERGQWLDDLSLEQIVAEVKTKRRKPRRSKS